MDLIQLKYYVKMTKANVLEMLYVPLLMVKRYVSVHLDFSCQLLEEQNASVRHLTHVQCHGVLETEINVKAIESQMWMSVYSTVCFVSKFVPTLMVPLNVLAWMAISYRKMGTPVQVLTNSNFRWCPPCTFL